jgi:hypothetical protein
MAESGFGRNALDMRERQSYKIERGPLMPARHFPNKGTLGFYLPLLLALAVLRIASCPQEPMVHTVCVNVRSRDCPHCVDGGGEGNAFKCRRPLRHFERRCGNFPQLGETGVQV